MHGSNFYDASNLPSEVDTEVKRSIQIPHQCETYLASWGTVKDSLKYNLAVLGRIRTESGHTVHLLHCLSSRLLKTRPGH